MLIDWVDSPYTPTQNPPRAEVVDEGPHEMPVPSRNPSASVPSGAERPFSYTDSEAGFTAARPRKLDEKSETGTYPESELR